MKNKSDSERIHSHRRAIERYGLKASQNMRDKLRCSVKSGGAEVVRRQSLRVTVYDAIYRIQSCDTDDESRVGKLVILRFAWDKVRGEIITFLPREESKNE